MQSAPHTLTLVVSEEQGPAPARDLKPGELHEQGPREWLQRKVSSKAEIDLERAKDDIEKVQEQVECLLESVGKKDSGKMRLAGVEVGLAISAEGSIGVATVGAEVSITLSYSIAE